MQSLLPIEGSQETRRRLCYSEGPILPATAKNSSRARGVDHTSKTVNGGKENQSGKMALGIKSSILLKEAEGPLEDAKFVKRKVHQKSDRTKLVGQRGNSSDGTKVKKSNRVVGTVYFRAAWKSHIKLPDWTENRSLRNVLHVIAVVSNYCVFSFLENTTKVILIDTDLKVPLIVHKLGQGTGVPHGCSCTILATLEAFGEINFSSLGARIERKLEWFQALAPKN
ncbi:hypothetical protein Salat_0323600 [Sesamum alatum]|uniref:Uncharacterized protein n=1 Tax=Sesamum alatum TaxID=300844 RepID=A0AAE1Z0W5_9LAMI|nr:hypothetical protein Salat_0323600 [Sesamum alatum]